MTPSEQLRSRRMAPSPALAALLPSAFLIVMLGLPLYWIVRLSLGFPAFHAQAYTALVDSDVHLRVMKQTLSMAIVATLAALVLGYPAAYVMARLRPPWRQLALCAVLLPLWTSLLVRTYAWIIILSPRGPISQPLLLLGLTSEPADLVYNRIGALVGLTHSIAPYVILPIYAAISKLDPRLAHAAASLGSSPGRTFLHVVLPLTLPGVIAGALFGFLLGLGAFVIPALLGGTGERTIAMTIEAAANQSLDWNLAAALAIELLLATLLILFLQHQMFGLGAVFGADVPIHRLRRSLRPLVSLLDRLSAHRSQHRGRALQTAVATKRANSGPSRSTLDRVMSGASAFTFVFLTAPLLVVVPISFSSSQYLQFPPTGFSLQWYERYLTSPLWLQATALSAVLGAAVVALTLVLGTLAAAASARARQPWSVLLTIGCLAPMIIPNMVLALGLFFAFSRLGLTGTVGGLVLAHTLLALPFAFVTVSAGLKNIDPHHAKAASILGARPFVTFTRVILPQLKPSLLVAALFAFIISFDEVVVSLFLTSVSVRTLPKLMWENITMFVDPTISAVSVVLIVLSTVLVLASNFFSAPRSNPSRKLGAP